MAINPFPGTLPYGAADRDRFFGRADSADQLCSLILANRCVALHGPVGAGKSSLLQAAVLPTLVEKHDTRIIRVDEWPNDEDPLEHLAAVMRAEFGISESAGEETAKDLVVRTVRSAARTSPRTLLICLDHLEKVLDSDCSPQERRAFGDCLDELLGLSFPSLKFVLVIRDESLGHFRNCLRDSARATQNSFYLGNLRVVEAVDAVMQAIGSGDPPQEWSIDEVHALVVQMRVAGQMDSDEAEVQLPLVQIVCRSVFADRAAGKTVEVVEVEPILRHYVEKNLAVFGELRSKVESLLEAHVARVDGSRILRSENEVAELFADAPELANVLRKLEAAAILRPVEHQGTRFWEITHNAFAQYVFIKRQSRERTEKIERERVETRDRKRKEQRQRRRIGTLVASSVLIALGTSGLGLWARNQQKLAEAATEIARKAENEANAAKAEAEAKAIAASDARLMVGFRELRYRGQVAPGLKLLHEVQKPATAPEWIALANDGLRASTLEVTLRAAHEPFSMAAWSPNGKRIAAGAADGVVWTWSVTTEGAPMRTVVHEKRIVSIDWSPDGEHLLTASEDGTARIIAADGSGKPVIFNPNVGPLRRAVFSPDGTRIAAIAGDSIARVWQVDGTGPIEIRGHAGELTSIAFMPDGKSILTSSMDRTARISAVDGSGRTVVFPGHQGPVRFVSSNAEGTFVVTASDDKTARIFSTTGIGAPVVFDGHGAAVVHAEFSPDGRRIVTTSRDETVRNWPADGRSVPIVLAADGMAMESASFRKDGRYILGRSEQRSIAIWPATGGDPLRIDAHDGPVATAVWSPDGKRALSAAGSLTKGNARDATVKVWRLGTLEALSRIRNPYYHSASILSGGEMAVAACDDGSAQLFRIDGEGEPRRFSGHEGWVSGAFASVDGKSILTTSFDKTARIWKADGTGEPVVLRGSEGPVRAGAFSPDGRRVVTVSDDKKIRIWKIDEAAVEHELSGHTDLITSVTWSPDGVFVLTTSMDRTARVWRADGSRQPVVLKGHLGGVVAAAWTSDSSRIVTASEDHTAGVWNSATGQLLTSLEHQSPVIAVAWSLDDKSVVTSSLQHGLRVWKADGTEDPLELPVDSPAIALRFLDDGRRIVSISEDDTIRTYIIDIETLLGQLDGANRDCLSPRERVTYLGETPETAETLHEACERLAKKLPVVTESR